MRSIAVLGASSQIAKDLIRVSSQDSELLLYGRDVPGIQDWLDRENLLGTQVFEYSDYGAVPHDVVINFVGVGDPQRAASMGNSIFEITSHFDDLVMAGLRKNPARRYIFLSSGAAYGSTFLAPASFETISSIAINNLPPQEYYAVAKLHAEAKHRAHPDLSIVDIRVFNYFSRTQDLGARFFITDVVRALGDGTVFQTTSDVMMRDYLHPSDFKGLVEAILASPAQNDVVDCYSQGPVEKAVLLESLANEFDLRYEVRETSSAVNATGTKPYYYSLNRRAETYGYIPRFSSLTGVARETAAILSNPR